MSKLNSTKTLKDFSYLVGIGIPLIFGFVIPKLTGHEVRIWTFVIGLILILLGQINADLLKPFYRSWMFLGEILGWLNSRIILALVYLLVLQPIAIIMKLLKYDPLRKNKKQSKSYREKKKDKKIDLTRIF